MTILQADLIRKMCINIVDGNHAQFSSAIDRLERTCDDYVHGMHKHRSDPPASMVADQKSVISDLRNQIADLMKDKEASVSACTQIMGALDRAGLRRYDGSLADNVVDVIKHCATQEKQIDVMNKEIKALNGTCEIRQMLVDESLDIRNALQKQLTEMASKIDEQQDEILALKKEVEDRNDEIAIHVINNPTELVLAYKEIIDCLSHWGLRHNTGSLVSNVTDVIKQCAAQEKKIDEFRKVVRDRNNEIEKLTKRIDVMERAAQTRQQFDETDRLLMEKKDKEIESLQERIAVAQGFTQQDREIIAARNTEIADLRKQVSTLTKQVSQRDTTISVLNKEIESLKGGLK